jgi:hypothetical protein
MAVRKSAAAKPEPEAKVDDEAVEAEAPVVPERTGFVRRNLDGSSAQRPGFVLVVEENPSDAELIAAWNLNGELPPKSQPIEYVHRTW